MSSAALPVAIIGAGPVGLAAAQGLKTAPIVQMTWCGSGDRPIVQHT